MKKLLIFGTCLVVVLVSVSYYAYTQKFEYPVGIVIPHHDMVAPIRQAYLASISKNFQPKTIILISPDHFDANVKPIISVTKSFSTALGSIESDIELIKKLSLPLQESAFDTEHGITSLLQDIKKNFPNAKLVPVMINRKATYQNVTDFIQLLNKNCPDCFLIASVDFSHTNTELGAQLHDIISIRELSAANPIALYKKAEVDSPETLVALVQWAQLHSALKFKLDSHTNSGTLFDSVVGEMTTHIMGEYFRGAVKPQLQNNVTLMIGGDVMFAREVANQNNEQKSNTITKLIGDRFFWGVDGAIINLEGVFTSRNDDIEQSWNNMPPVFRFDPSFIDALSRANIDTVLLANNHTFDGGETDVQYTKLLLENKNISVVGYPRNNSSVKIYTQGNTKVALMGFPTHENTEDISLQVKQYVDKGYRVIVYLHWGEEYETLHSQAQEELAQRLIDAGSSLIVGSHPHVVQDISLYKNTPIVYSLGNFLFDQSFADTTQIGAVLGVTIHETGIEIFIVPVANYINPNTLSEKMYTQSIQTWTQPWEDFKTKNKTYFFPFTK